MRKVLFILLVVGLVFACFTAAVSAKSSRPFKGTVTGEVWFTPDSQSPSPWGLWSHGSGNGTVSRMGLTAFSCRHPTPETTDIRDGRMTLVAANGDEVWATYRGYAPFPDIGVPSIIVAETAFTVSGGTGRFAHASGGGDLTGYVSFLGVLDLGPWPATWVLHGRIRY